MSLTVLCKYSKSDETNSIGKKISFDVEVISSDSEIDEF